MVGILASSIIANAAYTPICPIRTKNGACDLRCKVEAVAGDIAQPGLGLAKPAASALAAGVNIVLHCAASIAFDASVQTLLATNYKARFQLCVSLLRSLQMP